MVCCMLLIYAMHVMQSIFSATVRCADCSALHHFSLHSLLLIERALHTELVLIQYVSVDLRRFDVLMAEQFLDGTQIVAGFQKMRCKAVTKTVGEARRITPAFLMANRMAFRSPESEA